MDPHHHQLEMCSETLESMLVCTNPQQEKKATKPAEQGMKCPRCDSINTKFCYYNNYSLTQPRYFCKSCRRYWTKGGTLRNVPVGGGCRKNKRSSSKRAQENPTLLTTTTTTTNNNNDNSNPILSSLAPSLSYDYSTDLNLAFAMLQQKQQHNAQMGFEDYEFPMMGYNNNISVNNAFENNFYNHGQTSHFENGGSVGMNNGGEPFVKQEGEQNSNRILWGFPWQINNGGDANMGATNLDAVGKPTWNGYGSTWQGLINSPLL